MEKLEQEVLEGHKTSFRAARELLEAYTDLDHITLRNSLISSAKTLRGIHS